MKNRSLREDTGNKNKVLGANHLETGSGAVGLSIEARMEGRRGGPPKKAWDEGRVWLPDSGRVPRSGGVKTSSLPFLPQPLASCVQAVGDCQGPTSQRLLSNYSPQGLEAETRVELSAEP